MAKKIIKARMQQRQDTLAGWAGENPVLLPGELGLVSDDPNAYKVGDGVTAWNDLPMRGWDGNIAQTTGDSTTAVMSQKAVTEELDNLSQRATNLSIQANRLELMKVTVVPGRGLSTNDYSDAEKQKLAGLQNYDDTELRAQVTQKADRSELTELSAEIIGKNITMPVAIEKVEGYNFFDKKYINTNASALPSPIAFDSVSCMQIECKEGEQYRIVAQTSGASVLQLWAFWGADYALIEKSDINTLTSFREDILIVTAPQGAAYLTVNMYQYTDTDGVYLLNSITKKSIKDSVDSVPLVKELEEEVRGEYISYKEEIPQIEGVNFFDKKYINTNTSALPAPIALDSASCMQIECKEGEQYIIFAQCTTSAVLQLWAFWRADYSMIEKSNISVVTSFREDGLIVTAPKDAAYLTINMYQYQEGDKVLKTLSISKKEIADELNKEDATSSTPLYGKTIVCFGDSITEYADYNGKRYSDYMAEFTGANVINVGVGGTRIEKRTEVVASPTNQTQAYAALDVMSLINAVVEQNFDNQFAAANSGYINKSTYLPIVERLSEIDFSKVDAITIFAGTNSWRNSRALGSTGQRDSEYYILSAVNLIIERISQKYPHIKIYWFLPIVRWIDSGGFTDATWCDNFSQSGYIPGDLSLTLGQFKDLVKTEVVKNHIPVCDLYDELGFNKFNFWNYFPRTDLGDRQTDGTHPLKGMNVIAKKIASFIQSNLLF